MGRFGRLGRIGNFFHCRRDKFFCRIKIFEPAESLGRNFGIVRQNFFVDGFFGRLNHSPRIRNFILPNFRLRLQKNFFRPVRKNFQLVGVSVVENRPRHFVGTQNFGVSFGINFFKQLDCFQNKIFGGREIFIQRVNFGQFAISRPNNRMSLRENFFEQLHGDFFFRQSLGVIFFEHENLAQSLMSVRFLVKIFGRVLVKNFDGLLSERQRVVDVFAVAESRRHTRANVRQILFVLHVVERFQNFSRLVEKIYSAIKIAAESRKSLVGSQSAVAVHAEIFAAHDSDARIVVSSSKFAGIVGQSNFTNFHGLNLVSNRRRKFSEENEAVAGEECKVAALVGQIVRCALEKFGGLLKKIQIGRIIFVDDFPNALEKIGAVFVGRSELIFEN